jgi:hypothetical protein
MILLMTIIAMGDACPKEDLYAVGLNAYVIQVGQHELSLEMKVERGRLSNQPVVDQWREMLNSCSQEKPIQFFDDFIQKTDHLYLLGEKFQNQPKWSLRKRRAIRLMIKETERETALSYATFLLILQQYTGIAVKWDKEAHFLAPGMISTAGGSELVADYVIQMWE